MYLIAHKVRGQRAFDVAEPMDINGETWWIIPTSGHRAYPYWVHKFDIGKCICQEQHRRGYCTEPGCPYSPTAINFPGDCPEDLPDHYPALVRVIKQQVTLEELDL